MGQRRQPAWEWFFNCIKCERIPKIMKLVELSPYRMRMPWKKIEKVSTMLSRTMLTNQDIRIRYGDKHVEMSWFVSIVRDNVLETFSIFFHGIRIRFGDNSTSFMIFGIRSHFIQLKNHSHASWRRCPVSTLIEISRRFLDLA